MGIRFAKSIKIGNYLRINFTKNGVSATIGKRGASVNVGTKGAYLNLSPAAVGVNGTGLSYRQKILSLGSSKKKIDNGLIFCIRLDKVRCHADDTLFP